MNVKEKWEAKGQYIRENLVMKGKTTKIWQQKINHSHKYIRNKNIRDKSHADNRKRYQVGVKSGMNKSIE